MGNIPLRDGQDILKRMLPNVLIMFLLCQKHLNICVDINTTLNITDVFGVFIKKYEHIIE